MHAPLRDAQNAVERIIRRLADETITARLAARGRQNAGLRQLRGDLFEILFRNLLPLGNVPQRNHFVFLMRRDVQQHTDGVAPLGGNFHLAHLQYAYCTINNLEKQEFYILPIDIVGVAML